MPHDIQFLEPANRQQAEMLFEALDILAESEGEPWQQQERQRENREHKAKLLGEE